MDTYCRILEHYSLDKMFDQVVEECAELIIALNKWRRSPDDKKPDLRIIAEEIADMEIMLEQMKTSFQCGFLVETLIEQKLERALNRMRQ